MNTMALVPESITYHKQSKILEVGFGEGNSFKLTAHYLRVFSPSAEVRGHGLSEPMLVLGKEAVAISKIEPIGNYAIKIEFDDGHNTGIYSWEFLHELGKNFPYNWQRFCERVKAHA